MEAFWDFIIVFGWPLAVVLLIASLIAGIATRSTFKKFGAVANSRGLTGAEIAQRILGAHQLSGKFGAGYTVAVERSSGTLTDHYSPREKVLRLSDGVYASASIAAAGVAAHECGHALQDAEGYFPNKIRSAIAPVAGIGSKAGPYIAIAGVLLLYQMPNTPFGTILLNIGIIAYFIAFVFYLVTLPVEFDASRRAIAVLREEGILTESELPGARKVLRAAAMTYVVAALASLLTLLRLMSMGRRRRG